MQFLQRFNDESHEEDVLERLGIKSDKSDKEPKYIYSPTVFSLDHVIDYNKLDELHTTVYLVEGRIKVVKTNFRMFKYMLEFFTGRMVRSIEDFGFEEMIAEKAEQIEAVLSKLKTQAAKDKTVE